VKFYFDENIKDTLSVFTDDLMGLSDIPTLEFGKNVFWHMISVDCEEDALKCADKFFKDTFEELYKTNTVVTVIRFQWNMTHMYSSEDVLVYFMMSPNELKNNLNSVLKMKAFW